MKRCYQLTMISTFLMIFLTFIAKTEADLGRMVCFWVAECWPKGGVQGLNIFCIPGKWQLWIFFLWGFFLKKKQVPHLFQQDDFFWAQRNRMGFFFHPRDCIPSPHAPFGHQKNLGGVLKNCKDGGGTAERSWQIFFSSFMTCKNVFCSVYEDGCCLEAQVQSRARQCVCCTAAGRCGQATAAERFAAWVFAAVRFAAQNSAPCLWKCGVFFCILWRSYKGAEKSNKNFAFSECHFNGPNEVLSFWQFLINIHRFRWGIFSQRVLIRWKWKKECLADVCWLLSCSAGDLRHRLPRKFQEAGAMRAPPRLGEGRSEKGRGAQPGECTRGSGAAARSASQWGEGMPPPPRRRRMAWVDRPEHWSA